ncbi:MAG: hypothetical protein V3V26_03075 [Candidatus Aenigmarchaeota archaeon]
MDDFKYFLSGAYLREIEERFPLSDAVIVDINPHGELFDQKGPVVFKETSDAVQEALRGKKMDVMEKTYQCVRSMPDTADSDTEVIVANGKGHELSDIRQYAADVAPGSKPYVCRLTDQVGE